MSELDTTTAQGMEALVDGLYAEMIANRVIEEAALMLRIGAILRVTAHLPTMKPKPRRCRSA